ncbi:SGNH/GDSL hydrolase family protein [Nocardioides marmoribigeumensis]|uniref:Lysophospholipase L1-like esterase n=1 Tax=Nocardioides marmoribigeumensis TaxID=433649 RepID=A0ABU2C0Y6_9ACTN|nr:SGNH/GDSL hydrolase family protein [Nocardioides marmoribigeumensis]MDR7364322.1 lysophospholipase L1-like esterase [Nocardioides marmoribigeumensis]
MDPFTYDNRTGREPGRVLRALGLVLPGVRRVQRHVAPYAEAWVAHNRAALAQPGRRWYVLGDSMSQSVGATSWDRGWVHQLHERLTASGRGLVVVNLSATGAVLSDVLDQQVPLLDSLLASDPLAQSAVVTVLVGSNDLFNKAHRPHLPGRFEDLLPRLPEGSVVSTLPQPRAAAQRSNAHIRAAEGAGRIRVVDMTAEGPRTWIGKVAADRFHPNDKGYAALADAFEPTVVRAYDETPVER